MSERMPEASGADDQPDNDDTPPTKEPLDPNEGKDLAVEVDDAPWVRLPIQTELFTRGDALADKVTSYVEHTVPQVSGEPSLAAGFERAWYVVLSEKIVAISQGRSYFTWEISPGTPATVLSRFVQRTPAGIGLGSPWTMQLAINEAGLLRIIMAAAVSIVGKALGRRGWFYRVAGHRVNAIDGPTPYSAYPSNVSAKLPPNQPAKVAASISAMLRARLPEYARTYYGGTVVIDANDLGCDVLGQDTDRPDTFFTELFRDNPFGQGRQQTPIAICMAGDV